MVLKQSVTVDPLYQETCVKELEFWIAAIKEGKVQIESSLFSRDIKEVGRKDGFKHYELDHRIKIEIILIWPPVALS